MANLSKEHYWTVGFPNDPNSKIIEVANKQIIAIPYTPFSTDEVIAGMHLSKNDEIIAAAFERNERDISIHAFIQRGDRQRTQAQDGRFVALGCQRLSIEESEQLAQNINCISSQLGIKGVMRLTGGPAEDEADLPVLRPALSSTMKARTVYLLAARR